MKRFSTVAIAAFLLLSFVGCMTVQLTTEGIDKPVSMTSNVNKSKFMIVKHFHHELKGIFTLFNLITVSDVKFNETIRNEIQDNHGDAAINVKIQGQTTFVDGVIPIAVGVVGALITPAGALLADLIGLRTYTVEGDVIKYQD